MGFRVVTWNVNGIRSDFQFAVSFEFIADCVRILVIRSPTNHGGKNAMFDSLEADIVVFQETKIQKKDLLDDIILVPGWDCYFSLPKFKKGYSGVAIYTRNASCSPIRAEEGITGILPSPNSTISFRDLPSNDQVGGYPTEEQLSSSDIDPATIDSEGRCVILEFPAYVLIGVYCPASRDDTRDEFRMNFLDILDHRIRNLSAMGKRVVLAGDLNISRDVIDSAHAAEQIKKGKMTPDEFVTSPARRLLNHLVDGGRVVGDKDPASLNISDWVEASNIQEGLLGSDHCPVYCLFKNQVLLDGKLVHIVDAMNPAGTFKDGNRLQEYSASNALPLSGKRILGFSRRRNIRDMFARKDSDLDAIPKSQQLSSMSSQELTKGEQTANLQNNKKSSMKRGGIAADAKKSTTKRPKRETTGSAIAGSSGQHSIKNFFGRRQASSPTSSSTTTQLNSMNSPNNVFLGQEPSASGEGHSSNTSTCDKTQPSATLQKSPAPIQATDSSDWVDPFSKVTEVEREQWSKLFRKKPPPKCDGHGDPCISLSTKKPGVNCGRHFWICSRPLGPSGEKESGTEWRCPTFIWGSDWNG
ncbi:Class II abasic (AP) endonuclease [Myotisia sp. PD_48]|nr:Class II abasic (AP) endonuclease [Myotisia sp. PD_48]